jgi:hypothetical protein
MLGHESMSCLIKKGKGQKAKGERKKAQGAWPKDQGKM